MISKLIWKRKPTPFQSKAAVPHDMRVYAIGDIHGRLDLLTALLDKIDLDDARRGNCVSTLLFLGDLIDRGPESAQVVEYLRQLEASREPGATRFLLGNHEEVFLKAVGGDEKALRFFTKIGGRETILSYGVTESQFVELDYRNLLEMLQTLVPASHVEFLSRFEDLIVLGDYVFVHAGIRPGAPLARQRQQDLRWIRDEFLNHDGKLEKVVVHGHTISDEVEISPFRIGLDTGAYASGRLSGMGFQGDQRWIIQTDA